MKIFKIALGLVLVAQAVAAQDWNLRDSDRVLSAAEITQIGDGAALTYFDNGVSLFSAGGAYSYTYANDGGTAFGTFRAAGDGVICIDYRNGFSRCDMYVHNSGRIVLLTEDGERYPIKSAEGILP